MSKSASGSRLVAARVLERVVGQHAYASIALDRELSKTQLSDRDRAFATEITYGTLRYLFWIDEQICPLLRQPLTKLDSFVLAVLRTAAYQLFYLERVPAHAIVSESTTLVARVRGRVLSGLTNAVLRKMVGRGEGILPPSSMVLPSWLHDSLQQSLGEDRKKSFLEHASASPGLCLRVQLHKVSREQLAEEIVRVRPKAEVRLGVLSPSALWVRRAGDPRSLPGYDVGWFSVQEEGAQTIGWLLGAREGERIADVCAGHGGKTLQIAGMVGDGGSVTAIDLYQAKLDALSAEQRRLGLESSRIETQTIDMSLGTGGLLGTFDRVLVDAPCSGIGTLHRRPDLLLRLQPDDIQRLAALQLRILRNASRLVRPNGLLVFAVCSLTKEEGARVVADLARECSYLHPEPGEWPLPHVRPDSDEMVRLGPWAPDLECDGYQIFRWRIRTQGVPYRGMSPISV